MLSPLGYIICVAVLISLLGFTPLEYAVQNGHLPAVRYLLDCGADLHQQRSSLTLLHSAAVHGTDKRIFPFVVIYLAFLFSARIGL